MQTESHWTLYYHATDDRQWSVDSYKKIMTITSVEEAVSLVESLPDILITNGMLFLMRGNILPMWEDVLNKHGGGFSYKIPNKHAAATYRMLLYAAIGNCISSNYSYAQHLTGITSSQKRGFAIMKIWMSDCSKQDASNIDMLGHIKQLNQNGTTFIAHGAREKK